MSEMEITNWKTTSALLRNEDPPPITDVPFKTRVGLKDERKNAG
jgi:hypothetical protein